jgi:hypothetical protein
VRGVLQPRVEGLRVAGRVSWVSRTVRIHISRQGWVLYESGLCDAIGWCCHRTSLYLAVVDALRPPDGNGRGHWVLLLHVVTLLHLVASFSCCCCCCCCRCQAGT